MDKQKDKLKEYNRKLATLDNRNSYSNTDKDATFMHMKENAMRNGHTKPGYKSAGFHRKPVHHGLRFLSKSRRHVDHAFLASFKEKYGHFTSAVIADSGYGSEENYRYMEENDMEAYVKYNRFHIEHRMHHTPNPFSAEGMYYNKEKDFYVCLMGHSIWNGQGQSTEKPTADILRSPPVTGQGTVPDVLYAGNALREGEIVL